jgi:hypothetical protein
MSSAFPLSYPLFWWWDEFDIVPEIYNQIDLNKFTVNADQQGFVQYCKQNHLSFFDRAHPTTESHRHFVDNMLKYRLDQLLK